jgi:hypothetical protein
MSPMDSFVGIYTAIHGLASRGARRFSGAIPFPRSRHLTPVATADLHVPVLSQLPPPLPLSDALEPGPLEVVGSCAGRRAKCATRLRS